jgi:hypothetical protein
MLTEKYYNSIDNVPLFNWWKIRDGKYEFARKDMDVGSENEDIEAYIYINDSYLKEFGFTADEQKIIDLKMEIALLQCDYVINDDNFIRNQIRRLEVELEETLNRDIGEGIDREEFLIHLEKWIGFRLEPKEITARYYYKLEKQYTRYHDQLSKG